MEAWTNWLNSNQGVLALISIVVAIVVAYRIYGKQKKDAIHRPIQLPGISISNAHIHGNGGHGINIQTSPWIPRDMLSTHQRIAVEELRRQWSEAQGLDGPVSIYSVAWREGEMEWVNVQLQVQGKIWRVDPLL